MRIKFMAIVAAAVELRLFRVYRHRYVRIFVLTAVRYGPLSNGEMKEKKTETRKLHSTFSEVAMCAQLNINIFGYLRMIIVIIIQQFRRLPAYLLRLCVHRRMHVVSVCESVCFGWCAVRARSRLCSIIVSIQLDAIYVFNEIVFRSNKRRFTHMQHWSQRK